MPARRKILVLFCFIILIVIFFKKAEFCYGQNLLENSGFESGNVGPWSTSGGGTTAIIVTDQVHSGSYALKIQSSSTSTYGFQQEVNGIGQGENYRFSGFIKVTDSNIEKAFLRIGWYDGSGSPMGSPFDSPNQVTEIEDWEEISMEKIAPTGAVAVKVRAVIASKSSETSAYAYFDDLSFEEINLPSPTVTTAQTPTPTTMINDYSNIFLSEYLPYPETGNDEWVELYNDNDFEVNLDGWYLDDLANAGSNPKKISGKISSKSYKQFSLSVGSYFNNDGDEVRLLNGNQNEKDKTSFESSTKGQSWSKDSEGDWCETDPTPNSSNPDCWEETSSTTGVVSPTTTKSPSPIPTATIKPTVTPTPTPSPAGEILGATESGEATASLVLGEQNEKKEASASRQPSPFFWPKILVGLGLLLIFGATYPFWLPKIKKIGYNLKQSEKS